jgi:hypothetical protein
MDEESQDLLDRMHLLTGTQFESLCADLFEALGYTVQRTPTTADRGIDLFLAKDGRDVLVQCKRQQSTVGEPAVRDFFGVVTHRGADKGIFCTNGSFSTRAETWAAGTRIELMDGAELVKLWRRYAARVDLPKAAATPPQMAASPPRERERPRSEPQQSHGGLSKGVVYRMGQADKKWVAAGCEALGIPRPSGRTDYTQVDGIVAKRLYAGPDGKAEFVVVRDGRVLFRTPSKRSMLDYFNRVKLD